MLWAVLLLVVLAGGVLVVAVLGGHAEWAWLSVLFSVLGAGLLVVERSRRRRATRPAGELGAQSEPAELAVEQTREIAPPQGDVSASKTREADADPEQESTDAADLLVLSASDAEVLVVDERPRYHLPSCGWLGSRLTIPVPVREARELGFTPCARCAPDAKLAGRARLAR